MKMKKILSVFTAALLVSVCAIPVSAHGGHRKTNAVTYSYSVCTTQNCAETGLHIHDKIAYTAHYYGDGHDYHGYCTVENCSLSGYHAHDGAYCFSHTKYDGYGYHSMKGLHH